MVGRTRELSVLYKVAALASQSLDLEATLAQSLGLVLPAVDSGAGAIHLLDEEGDLIRLVVQRDLPPDVVAQVNVLPARDGLLGWVVEHDQPLVLSDLGTDPRMNLPDLEGAYRFVGLPMRAAGRRVGVLSVLRAGSQPPYRDEDVALLASIAGQVGILVESTRLRRVAEQAAVIEERQRLARELHDSVTQSLYSLTLLTEGGRRLARERSLEDIEDYFADLGDIALQCLKEMRLLVYELRGGMLEQEDLVGALRQRLEAVEHRSGLEASLLVERDVTVSDQAEAVLYGIAQEALNNALKHAQARTVVVSLRCSDEGAAILEVVDDGCGFEPACVGDEGGMGLTSMRERAARMGGALVILSEPGGGTTVRVSLPEACRTAAEVGW